MGRSWLGLCFALVLTGGALVGACGSSGDGSEFGPGAPEAGPGGDETGGPIFTNDSGPNDGSPTGCVKKTCSDLGANCGPQGDGCGGTIQCGDCKAPETCGGGGTPSQCGGNSGCVPKTCAQLGANCGAQGDGCGGLIPSCGTCTAPEICGGSGKPSVCGAGVGSADAGTCTPTKNACAPGDCGPVADGCGGLLQCPGCTLPQICGGGGTPSKCGGGTLPDGGPICTPKTCAQLGFNCGPAGDGCGGLIASCGTCSNGSSCGLGGPGKCGGTPDAGQCTGLCGQVPNCDGGSTTTLSGTVVSPRTCIGAVCNSKVNPTDADPIPNAVVFIPNAGAGAIQPFPPGVHCDQCGGAGVQGGVLVSATTGADGKFTLTNVPVGANIPVVVQLGRWRRVFNMNINNACAANTAGDLHLPKNKSQGDIPLTGLATGGVDTLECVLRKIGLDDAEFTAAGGTGRIQMYQGDTGPSGFGARPAAGNPVSWTTLYGNQATLNLYDQLIFECNGDPAQASMADADRTRVLNYMNAGGRLFTTHYEYVWLNAFAPFSATATWAADQTNLGNAAVTGDVDTSFPKGLLFSQWLANVGSLSNASPPKITINVSRHDINPLPNPPGTGVTSPAQRWISVDPNLPNGSPFPSNDGNGNNISNYVGAPQHYTFNTPWGAQPQNQCGRVLYSDFHVSNASVNNARFPTECGPATDALTPQEKVIEFFLFDLGSCIQPDKPPPPPTCTPLTCAQQGIQCGPAGDGCGGLIASCGTCSGNQTCGGGGQPGVCGGPTCTPKTCTQLGYNCGLAGDGCGGTIDCGNCTNNMNCGGGGSPNVCGTPSCTPTTCAAQNIACGPAGDGCGNILQCGPCTPPDTCGGGGTPGQCGHPTCTPRTCQQANANCGPVSDGCGGILNCGDCAPPQTCGGGGTPNQCGGGIR
jgi:hypothetical protein